MSFNDQTAEVQPKTTPDAQIVPVLLPKKHLKQRGQVLGIDPRAFILYSHEQNLIANVSQSCGHRPFLSGFDGNGYDALRRGVFERVGQQIDPDSLKTTPVSG